LIQLPDEKVAGEHAATGDRIIGATLEFHWEHRLHAPAEFSVVFAARRVLRGKCFDLHYAPRPVSEVSSSSVTSARLGLVVAKKLARFAVQRNLLKRLARETFRQMRCGLPAYDLVLRLARSPGDKHKAEGRKALREDMEKLLVRFAQQAR
jgi:ribonuclease P protein component